MLDEKYYKTRRTIRRYKPQTPDAQLIDNMLELASHAPTTGNMQLYSVIVTTEKQLLDKLAILHFKQPASLAPMLVTFCADFNRTTRWAELSNANPGFGNFQSFIAAMLDATILAQEFVNIAEHEGLGCCYLGTTTYNAPDIAAVLGLPTLVVPVVTIAVGYPDEEWHTSDRLPLESFRYKETYSALTDDQLLACYRHREELPENQQFVADNNKTSLAQVFTDIRYPRNNNEQFSTIFKDFLIKNGFSL